MRIRDIHLRGTRAAQPLATAVDVGVLYDVTDENDAVERSNGTVWQSYGPTGGLPVQVVNTQTGAVATGTTTIPIDDTIPQITEGNEYMTLAVTPTSVTSKLRIEVTGVLSTSRVGGTTMIAALFQDATANALAAVATQTLTAGDICTISFSHYMTAGTTSATTFRLRAGGAGAGTLTFNGSGGNRFLGGVFASSITITEIAV